MIEDIVNSNKFDYIDLGLPSGTLWATKNIGAREPSDYGLYFQWGDIKGYYGEQVGTDKGQKAFTWEDYKWNPSGDGKTFTKYTTYGEALELTDDAAHVNMKGDWHIPSPNQIQELVDNTIIEQLTMDEIKGTIFTSKKDSSKYIFIPAAGHAWKNVGSASIGSVWTSMLSIFDYSGGQNLNSYSYQGKAFLNTYNVRCDGLPIRGVIG